MGAAPTEWEAWLAELPHGVAALLPIRAGDDRVVDFRYDFVNEALARILGHDRSAMEGRLITEVHRQPDARAVIERLAAAFEGDTTLVEPVRVRSGMLGVTGRRVGPHLLVAIRDASEEARRSRAVQQLVDTLESSSDFVAIVDPVVDAASGQVDDFRVRFVNDLTLRRVGVTRAEAEGGLLSVLVPAFPVHFVEGLRQVVLTGVPYVGEAVLGTQRFAGALRLVASPFEDGVIISSRDTSGELLARAALAQSEAQFRATVEALHEAIFVVVPLRDAGTIVDMRIELVNEAAATLLRRTRSELVGATLRAAMPHAPRLVHDVCVEVYETGRSQVSDATWDEGFGPRTYEASVARSVESVVVAVQDVTERRHDAERLAESERRYRLLADHAGDVVLLLRDAMPEWIAPSIEQLLGFRPDELMSTTLVELLHPDDGGAVAAITAGLAESGVGRARVRARRADGSYLWVEVLVRSISDGDGERRGAVVATVWSVQAQVEAEQELERAERDRRAHEAQIQQATRLESLGVMAGGIAHDFNNLLVGVLGNAEMALHSLAEVGRSASPDAVAAASDRIGNVVLAAHRAAELTHQLLDYAGRRTRAREPVDLHELVDELPALVAPRLGAGVRLVRSVDDGSFVVLGDRGQLQQVLMNLVINASDALSPGGGTVTISLTAGWIDDETLTAGPDQPLAGGRYVVLEVADDGPGIDPDVLGRVFEPFFTTRSSGRGLGLAVVHGIVRSHTGRITAASTPGRGTTMTVLLPATEPASPPALGGAGGRRSFAVRPLVLVIDDDERVGEVSSLVLQSGGMDTEVEQDPRSAIARFASRPERYAAVLLDLTMPELPGDAVLAELRRIDPHVPVVIVSGYAEADLDGRIDVLGVDGFVRKPFAADDLLDAVAAACRPTVVGSP